MDIKTLVSNEDLLKYDELVNISKSAFIFQTRPYLESLKKLGYEYEILGYFNGDVLESAIAVQKKKFPLFKKYFYAIPYGIVSRVDVLDENIIAGFISYLKKKAYIIKLSMNEKLEKPEFKNSGYQTTIMIDLNESFDYIFENFSKTHRNCSRRALKDGVKVDIRSDLKTIDIFIDLYRELMNKKAIEMIDLDFLRNCLKNLVENKLGFFAVASYNDVIYNIAFITTVGKKARYLYGASRRTEDKLPPVGQFLHYEIIRYLKENDFSTYDLGGIPNPPVDENDSAYSVYKFKKGFGGNTIILCYDYYYTKYRIFKYLIH